MALSHTPLPRAGAAMHRQHASKTNGLAGPGGSGIWIMSLGAGPPEADFSLRFFLISRRMSQFLKRLSAAISQMKFVTIGYDETKPLDRFLWDVFAGWDWIEGYLKGDIVRRMIDEI